jgi:hypothetical protein
MSPCQDDTDREESQTACLAVYHGLVLTKYCGTIMVKIMDLINYIQKFRNVIFFVD